MRYLRKYLFKPLFLVLVVVILAILAINIFLAISKNKIVPLLSNYFGKRLSIETINYLPPNFVILENPSILGALPSSQPLPIERVTLAFSLRELITKRNFTIANVYLKRPKVVSSGEAFFLEEKIEQIIPEAINSLASKRSLKVVIKDGLLVLPREGGVSTHVSIDATSRIKEGSLSSFGSIGLENLSLDYSFKGYLTREGVTIDNLEFRRASFYSKLWGRLEGNVLRLKGFSSVSDYFVSFRLYEAPVTIMDRFEKILSYRRKAVPQIREPSWPGLEIASLNCVIKLVPQRIQIENLTFSLNKNFVKARGYLERGGFNGKVSLNLLRETKDRISPEEIEATFKNLTFNFTQDQNPKMSSRELALSLIADSISHKIFLKNFDALFNLKEKRFELVKFNSMIYDGLLEGEGMAEISQTPSKSSFDFKIRDASANRFKSLLAYFQKVYGKLDSQIYYRNYPRPNLEGKLLISDGYLDDVEFFNWLAGFFKIPALKKVAFDKLSTDFSIDDEVINLQRISLDSRDLNLDGHFSLYKNDLVSGKLSLALSRELLETSPPFKPLLKVLSKDIRKVSFDFQVSGLVGAMNFKWLESDFKRRLKDLLPASKEREIEEKVEEAIKSISTRQEVPEESD